MKFLLPTSLLMIVSCGYFAKDKKVINTDTSSQVPESGSQTESNIPGPEIPLPLSMPHAGKCDDPLNSLLVEGQCYNRCDRTLKYCLRHDEMASQLDPDKKVPLCSFDSNRILVDDQCGRGVIKIDSKNRIIELGNDLTDKPARRFEDGEESPGSFLADSSVCFELSNASVYRYPSNFPMLFETDVFRMNSIRFEVAGTSPGSKDHVKLNWLLDINGMVLDLENLTSNRAKDYCSKVIESVDISDFYSGPYIGTSLVQGDTFLITCTFTPSNPVDFVVHFYCHKKADKCFLKYAGL